MRLACSARRQGPALTRLSLSVTIAMGERKRSLNRSLIREPDVKRLSACSGPSAVLPREAPSALPTPSHRVAARSAGLRGQLPSGCPGAIQGPFRRLDETSRESRKSAELLTLATPLRSVTKLVGESGKSCHSPIRHPAVLPISLQRAQFGR